MEKVLIDKTVPLSQVIMEHKFEEVKGFLNSINGNKAYPAKDVDAFLMAVSGECLNVENEFTKLYKNYKKLIDRYNQLRDNGYQVDQSQGTSAHMGSEKLDSERNSAIAKREAANSYAKIQEHMAELLITAQEKSEQIVLDAEIEKNKIIDEAKNQAQELLEAAQEKANEYRRREEEKIQEIRISREQMEQQAREVETRIYQKAEQVEKMSLDFHTIIKDLKDIVVENRKEQSAT